LLPLHFLSIFCIFFVLYFVAKTIKTVELQKATNFGDFAPEFLMLWFYVVGIWIIQPRVNRLVANKNTNNRIDTFSRV
jgi:formate-dependent nitrite reductase membrane component NrfD